MLSQYGYINRKSVFIKLEDDVFFTICAKGRFTGEKSAIWTFVSPFPYCTDITPDDFDLRGLVDNMFFILQRIEPDKFTPEYYYHSLIKARSEEDTLRSLDSVCDIIEEFVLPYIHRFTDLEYYYNEIQIFKSHHLPPIALSDDELFFLLIKLRKYENALIHIDNQIEDYRNHNKRIHTEIDEAKIEEISLELRKLCRTSQENTIVVNENKISQLQDMKELVLAKDYNYFDNYIKKIDNRGREYLREMLTL